MKHRRFGLVAFAALLVTVASAQSSEDCLKRLVGQVDSLLKKDPPKLFAWHLRSLKAIAMSEFSKLDVDAAQRNHPTQARAKEFVEFTSAMIKGLGADCGNPDAALRDGRRGLVLARLSDTDGSLQYMMIDLPKNWDPTRAYPLLISLHGTGPDNPLAYPSYGFGPLVVAKPDAKPSPTADMIRLAPWGRGNRGWRGDAERDLFEAINLLKSFAKLDSERWYICGHSAGADGAWAIVQHTPDLWAAVGMQSGSMLSGRPEWGLVPNMTYLPVHFLIGANDNLPSRIPDTKEAYRIMNEAGADTKLVILPGVGHYPLGDEALEEQATWMVRHVRTRPNQFVFTVDQSYQPGVWGIKVQINRTALIKEPWPTFSCSINGQEVRIQTKNAKALMIDLGPNGLRLTGNVKVTVNGKVVHDGNIPPSPIDVKII